MRGELCVHVIGLPHSFRGESLEASLSALNLDVLRSDGVIYHSGNDEPTVVNQRLAQRTFGRSLTDPEVGCALAHMNVWRKLLDSDSEWALIVEDDAQVLNGAMLCDLIEGLQNRFLREATVILLYAENLVALRGRTRRVGRCDVVEAAFPPFTTTAYAINRAAAQDYVAHALPLSGPIDWPLRHHRKIRFYASVPVVFRPSENSMSTIGPRIERGRLRRLLNFFASLVLLNWLRDWASRPRAYARFDTYWRREVLRVVLPRLTPNFHYSTIYSEDGLLPLSRFGRSKGEL
jgi:glycosyl transferase family 25